MEAEFPGDNFFGPQYLMSDNILNRIVDLARHNKLTDIASLFEQTDWRHASKYGTQILELVNISKPPPPPPPPPPLSSLSLLLSPREALQDVLNPLSQVNEGIPKPGPKKSRRCTACGADNHICALYHTPTCIVI